jgi:hypothetical protein
LKKLEKSFVKQTKLQTRHYIKYSFYRKWNCLKHLVFCVELKKSVQPIKFCYELRDGQIEILFSQCGAKTPSRYLIFTLSKTHKNR